MQLKHGIPDWKIRSVMKNIMKLWCQQNVLLSGQKKSLNPIGENLK
jgi:hypothetical protein